MILSHRWRFIFIKSSKTAGTSIEVLLSGLCGEQDIVTPVIPPELGHQPRNHKGFYNHMTAAEIRRRVPPKVWQNYFIFTVERNPWEKALSFWHMECYRRGGGLSLDDYLTQGPHPLNYPKYTEPSDPNRIIVDHIIHYENLNRELGEVFSRLGMPYPGRLEPRAKGNYRHDRRPYHEVLTLAQAERIACIYAQEIHLHGYSFGRDDIPLKDLVLGRKMEVPMTPQFQQKTPLQKKLSKPKSTTARYQPQVMCVSPPRPLSLKEATQPSRPQPQTGTFRRPSRKKETPVPARRAKSTPRSPKKT